MDNILYDLVEAYGTVALPWGYLCMMVARAGYVSFDDNFKKAFIILIFASITHYAYSGVSHFYPSPAYILYPVSMVLSLGAALLWRRYLAYFSFL